MASTAEAPPPKAGPSLAVQLGLLAAMTLAAAGTGFVSGGFLGGGESEAPAAHAEEEQAALPSSDTVVPLAPMTTNLAAPADVWLRLELAIVLDAPQGDELPDLIHQDLLAYVRTLRLHQIEGASAFQHFRADLDERAAIRSDGHVKRVLIRTMLFE